MWNYICGYYMNECVLSVNRGVHFRAFANYKESEKKKKIVSNWYSAFSTLSSVTCWQLMSLKVAASTPYYWIKRFAAYH